MLEVYVHGRVGDTRKLQAETKEKTKKSFCVPASSTKSLSVTFSVTFSPFSPNSLLSLLTQDTFSMNQTARENCVSFAFVLILSTRLSPM